MAESRHAADAVAGSSKETLSQLLARVLDQLAISAWLPAAALTLCAALIFELGSVLNGKPAPIGPNDALSRTVEHLGRISIGSLVLLVVVIIVMTILTQAFSFKAIRILEGYWGIFPVFELYANVWCNIHRARLGRLEKRWLKLRKRAVAGMEKRMNADAQAAAAAKTAIAFTPNMISVLASQVLGTSAVATLSAAEQAKVNEHDWQVSAPPNLIRRMNNVGTRQADYPIAGHVLPTRLGNILRHYEDTMNVSGVETFIERVFDSLPASLQRTHDSTRTRLDLYGSMVFVLWISIVLALARFLPTHWPYAVSVAVIGVIAIWAVYRAALASARHFGGVIVVIANYSRQNPQNLQ